MCDAILLALGTLLALPQSFSVHEWGYDCSSKSMHFVIDASSERTAHVTE
jgi:hypothetical protein